MKKRNEKINQEIIDLRFQFNESRRREKLALAF